MEVPFKARMSVDDISLDSRPVVELERRARSSSPVKNRRSLPPNFFDMKLPPLLFGKEDDIRSMTSGSNNSLSPKQLKLLSNSPIFDRLHVNTSPERSQYVIPIPFTLKLPPKLSSQNQSSPRSLSGSQERSHWNERGDSPTRSHSPNKLSRLVYNGSKYEKLDSLSDSEVEDERNNRIIMRRPAPPPVTTNKRKSKKQNIQAKKMSHDELSTIDETSNYANSRTPSTKSRNQEKSLPLPPSNENINIGKVLPQSLNRSQLTTPSSTEPQGNFTFRVPNCATHSTDTYNANSMVPEKNRQNINDASQNIQSSLIRSATEDNIRLFQLSNAPIESNDILLKIHKRSFSDESKVSSLSSFSSFGGMLNTSPSPNLCINNYAGPQLLGSKADSQLREIENSRSISNGSTKSCESEVSSNASWNSLQKSINLSDSKSLSESPIIQTEEMSSPGIAASNKSSMNSDSSNTVNSLQSTLRKSDEFNYSDSDESEIADLYLNDSDVSMNDDIKTEVPAFQKTIAYNESDNEGAGSGFNFPAGSTNITNSKELKKSKSHTSTLRSSAYMAQYRSPSGQIEIPDLDDKFTTGKYSVTRSSCSFNGTTFDDINYGDSDDTDIDSGNSSKLEPIGFPSKAARNVIKEQFKVMHGDDDSDTDIESTKYSYFSTTTPKSKSTPCLSLTERQLPPLPDKADTKYPQRNSPVKHIRHKSMFSIDFDANSAPRSTSGTTRLKYHKRSKSVDLNNMISPSNSPNADSETLPLKTRNTKEVASPDEMKILVTEPPKPIDYAVDFKEATVNDRSANIVGVPNTKGICDEYQHNKSNKNSHNISEGINKLSINQNDVSQCAPYAMNQPQNYEFGSNPTPYNIPTPIRSSMTASSSGSSYQSSRTTKNTTYTSMSDSNSVIIDLTKDKYDLCMIQRNTSTQSYRSITEKTKEGKEVEVVLVDDEDENDDGIDELASIYSKYRNNWIFRTGSTTSCSSNASTASFESGIASESQLKLKPSVSLASRHKKLQSPSNIDRLSSQIQKQRFSEMHTLPLNKSVSGNPTTNQYPIVRENPLNAKPMIKELPRVQAPYGTPEGISPLNINSKYFDYTSDSYDFNSFMKQQVNPR